MKKQIFISGKNSLLNLKSIVGNKKVFVVSGNNSFTKSGAKSAMDSMLGGYGLFSGFSPNPKLEEVKAGCTLFTQDNYDIIVAIGGGSCMDVAKAIKLDFYEKSKVSIPMVACPTTAGSGSESTHFIVYYIGKEKQSKGDPDLTLPEYVVLDHGLLDGLPHEAFASSVLDALSQSIESHWSIHSTDESRALSKAAMETIRLHGLSAVIEGDDASREMILKGANLAGQAINITKTTACHSLAYPMTSYFGISHGYACSLTLSQILKYNYEVDEKTLNDSRGINFVKKIIEEIFLVLDLKNTTEFDLWLKLFITKLGLKYKLEDLGIDKSAIIKYGFNPDRVKNNPRILTVKNLEKIL
jgi:alcohol dehydrogenase class IV